MHELISKYRSVLMGWATLFILFGHSIFYGKDYVYYGPVLHQIIEYGYIGVDIFLFLSGFGLVYSIQKNTTTRFYRNRFVRLLPSLIVCAVFICMWYVAIRSTYLIPQINTWLSFWFLDFIIIAYLLFPLLYNFFFKKCSGWLSFVIVLVCSVLCFIPFIIRGEAVNCNPYVCAICRIPIFSLGALYAMLKCEILNKKYFEYVLAFLGVVILTLLSMQEGDFPNEKLSCYYALILMTPPLLYGLCHLSEISWMKNMNRILTWLGKYSLEIYLIQVVILPKLIRYGMKRSEPAWMVVPIALCVVIVVSYIAGLFADKLRDIIRKNNDKSI